MKSRPVILIEDDIDDRDILYEVFAELQLPHEILWFKDSQLAWDYLTTTTAQPFIILCDINLPIQNGIDFKKQIDENPQLRRKSIPFVFYSTYASQAIVNDAFTHFTVQGFFLKETGFEAIKNQISVLMSYWSYCKHPNAA